MESIQSFIDQLKRKLAQKPSVNAMMVNTLDEPSKNKQQLLAKYLLELQKTLKGVIDDLNHISPQVQQYKKQMDDHYRQIDKLIKNKQQLEIELKNLETSIINSQRDIAGIDNEIIKITDKINDLENQINSKRKQVEELIPQIFIPFYGIKVAVDIKKLQEETIPALVRERDSYANQKYQCEMKMNKYKELHSHHCSLRPQYHDQIQTTEKTMEDYNRKISSIHDEMADVVKTIAYLSILKDRMNSAIVNGETIDRVMEMLDKSPKIIHYGKDEMYFDMLEKWNQSHDVNVFKEFIMQSEKEFFS